MGAFGEMILIVISGSVVFQIAASDWRYHWLRHRGISDAWLAYIRPARFWDNLPSLQTGEVAVEARKFKRLFFRERPILHASYWIGLLLFWTGVAGLASVMLGYHPPRLSTLFWPAST